jgi:tetratricopeptide (TPR) repeat protein
MPLPFLAFSRNALLVGVIAAVLMRLLQPQMAAAGQSTSVVLAVDYTSEGGPNEDASNATETYFQLVLSRIHYGEVQRMADYNHKCDSVGRTDEATTRQCFSPEFVIQIQVAERQGEFQISGGVVRNVEPTNTWALDVTRGQVRNLSEGLWRATKNIADIIGSVAPETDAPHIVIACVASSSKRATSRGEILRGRLADPKSAIFGASDYAKRLPGVLKSQMTRGATRIRVSVSNESGSVCSSADGLSRIATNAGATAVLSGTVYSDDQGGLFLVPHLLLSGANKGIELSQLAIPADAKRTYDVAVGSKLTNSVFALVGNGSHADLVKAVREGAEVMYYLGQAKRYLSASPPNYDAAEALLELATVKSPTDEEPYLALASSLLERNRDDEAARAVRSGIRQIPNSRRLFLKLEDIAARKGDLEEAQRVYLEAINARMPEEDALLTIARTYMSAQPPARSLERALDYALRAASKNKSFVEAYLLAGQICESERNFPSAEQYYKEALKAARSPTPEVMARLSSLFSRWAGEDARSGRFDLEIEHLSKSIEFGSPSIKKYHDRAYAYLEYYGRLSDRKERAKGFQLASIDYSYAYQIARQENAILSQFPWLAPNLMESLIFEGKYSDAKGVGRELFSALASDANIRSSTDPNDIRIIVAFLNATAEMLDVGSAEKELYLFQNSLGEQSHPLPWSFQRMSSFLDKDFQGATGQLAPGERQKRVDAVKMWIAQLSSK